MRHSLSAACTRTKSSVGRTGLVRKSSAPAPRLVTGAPPPDGESAIFNMDSLMRVMGISLERGVTILATLGACRNVIPNAEFQRFIGELEVQVTEGRGIAEAFGGPGGEQERGHLVSVPCERFDPWRR